MYDQIASQATYVWGIIMHREMESHDEYQGLKDKWRGRLGRGEGGFCFALDRLEPNKFIVLWHDYGSSGACSSDIKAVGVSDGPKDFLSFIRHAELPRILDYDSDTLREPCPDFGDAYLVKYQGEQREKIDHLLGRLDLLLKRDATHMISESELCLIRDLFNQVFSETNPQVEIVAWGSLAHVLTSSALEEALEEAAAEEADEDADEQPCTQLKALLGAGDFDEDNEGHLDLARGFLEQALSF